jgi:DNA modification methylase
MTPYFESHDGTITIYHGDCRDVLPTFEAGSVDLVLTDPPYGIGANRMTLGNGRRPIYRGVRDWDSTPADLAPILALDLPSVIWGGNYFPLPPSRGWLVWDKGTGDNDYADCELAWTNRDAVVKKYVRSWVGANAHDSHTERSHPTQKPTCLMRWCIGLFPAAHFVLDPYMGSGTTLRAAMDLGRRAIGIEIEERYCEIAARRLSQTVLPLALATGD